MHIPDSLILRPHHRQAIAAVVERFASDETILAIIIGGSVAKGFAHDHSDVDAILLVTPQEYERRKEQNQLGFCDFGLFSYPGGYLDAKIVDEAFLRDAARFGSEPTRNSFVGAFVAFSRLNGLGEWLEQIARYPEEVRQERIESFWAQIIFARGYFWDKAEEADDLYLRTKCVGDLVLYTSRLLLAHNRILFPSHKHLRQAVARAPEKPAKFEGLVQDFLVQPTRQNKEALCWCVENFADWNLKEDAYTRYIRDTETAWRERIAPLAEA